MNLHLFTASPPHPPTPLSRPFSLLPSIRFSRKRVFEFNSKNAPILLHSPKFHIYRSGLDAFIRIFYLRVEPGGSPGRCSELSGSADPSRCWEASPPGHLGGSPLEGGQPGLALHPAIWSPHAASQGFSLFCLALVAFRKCGGHLQTLIN